MHFTCEGEINRVSVWDNEKLLEMDSGDGCTTLWKYLMPMNYTLKNSQILNFMFCIFCDN